MCFILYFILTTKYKCINLSLANDDQTVYDFISIIYIIRQSNLGITLLYGSVD